MSRALLLRAASVSTLVFTVTSYAMADQNTDSTPVETVVVTASPLSSDADASAIIAGKVNRDQILESGGIGLADALAEVPGVTGSGFAAGASRPIIRGMDSTRVRMTEDGIGSFDVSDVGPDHGVPIDPLSAQSIEVVRGAATLRYGSQAIGGVVNAINNRVPTVLPDEDISGEVSGTYGSNSNMGQVSAMTDARVGDWAIHADGYYRNAGNYDTPKGTEANSFFVGSGLSLGTSYFYGDNSHTGVAIVQYDAKYGIPSDDTYILMRQTKVLERTQIDWGTDTLGALTLDGGYGNYSHEEKNPDGSVNTTFKNREFEMRGEQMIGEIGPLSSSAVGFQVQHREYSAVGEDSSYLYPTNTTSAAGFLFTEAPITDALKLQLGGRLENVHITGTPASGAYTTRDFTPVSGALSLMYDANDWLTLGLTASTSGRAPAQTELFARGGHDGPQTYETGDPSLKIERANSLEGTARVRSDDLTIDASLWSSWFDNYIYGALTGRTCDDAGVCGGSGGDLRELNYTQTGAHFWGGEIKTSYPLLQTGAGKLMAEMQADYVRATLSGGDNVPRIPPYHVGGGLTWHQDNFEAGIVALYAGAQHDFGDYDTATPGYVDLSFHISVHPLDNNPGFEIALSGHNMTDDVQRNAASFNKDTIMMPGRDIRLVLRQAF